MGMLVNGKWQDIWYDTKSTGGKFVRKDSSFRHWVSADGSSGFKAELDRYHLYVSLACPWAHRTLIFRKLKGLEKMISLSVVDHHMGENGWTFKPGDGVLPDPINGADYIHQVYTAADPDYTGRATIPILWDKKTNVIVSNESAEIIRMFNSAFDQVGALSGDYYPETLRPEIDAINAVIYDEVNNGVYKAGFATTQDAYEDAVTVLFNRLGWLENHLARNRYLVGNQITEADWRLFTTLIRFDPVYFGHFKCNIRQIQDYPNLWAYTRELYQQAGVAETVNMDHIKKHYYGSHATINPTGVIPKGPDLDLSQPHGRDAV